VREQRFGSPGRSDGGTELRALIDNGAKGGCSGGGDSWATAQTAAQKQTELRPGALCGPEEMAVLDGAAQSADRSADAQRVKATMQNLSTATRRPGQAGQSPPVTPSLPSLPSTPTRAQPPAEAAPAAAATPTTGRGTRRGRDISPSVRVEDPDLLNRSFLEGLPAPRGSKDASGQPYDSAMSWVSARLQKQRTFKEAEKVI
jgi:hypothetical protein